MARIGYARVSTLDQDLEIQQQRLIAEGCQIVRCEKVSGASRQGRTELATIIEFLREDDELIVTRLDRLGRMPAAKAVCLELVISSKSMAYVMRYSDFPH